MRMMASSKLLQIVQTLLFVFIGSCLAARPDPFNHHPQQPTATNRRSLQQVPVGAIVGGVQAGVDLGLNAVAPIVNNLASNIPIMVPSFQGRCMNGEPVAPMKNKPDQIWCIVASGAQLTDGFFRAFAGLTGMAGNMAGMFMGR